MEQAREKQRARTPGVDTTTKLLKKCLDSPRSVLYNVWQYFLVGTILKLK